MSVRVTVTLNNIFFIIVLTLQAVYEHTQVRCGCGSYNIKNLCIQHDKPLCEDRGLAMVCEHSNVCLVSAKEWNFLMS